MQMNNGPSDGVTWVVVASAGQAVIYSRMKRMSPLETVQSFADPEARSKVGELESDAPGRSFDSGGEGRHAMETQQSPKDRLRGEFASRIVATLETARGADSYQHLIIVAEPRMLGDLRSRLSRATRQLVSNEIDKNMSGEEPAAIAALLEAECP